MKKFGTRAELVSSILSSGSWLLLPACAGCAVDIPAGYEETEFRSQNPE
jgi:hypothetical protein